MPASAHFPPLDTCLAGEARLISWKTAYRALISNTSASDNAALEAFLTDTETVTFLSNALDPFIPPGAKTKADFDGRTAPIHVSHSPSGEYDLEELKKDALWLSGRCEVEESVALRTVILEWQQRAEDHLLETTGHFGGRVKEEIDFSKEHVRRPRQLQLFLEEKSYVLKTGTELVNRVAVAEESKKYRNWTDDLAEKVTAALCSTYDASTHEAFCTSLINSIDALVGRLLDPSKWPQEFQSDDARKLMFESALWTDLTTSLRLLLTNLHMLQTVPGAKAVESWFKLMARMNFFQDLVPSAVLPSVEPLQCLIAIISVSLLQIPAVLNGIQESAETMIESSSTPVQYPNLGTQEAYYKNDACLQEINLILHQAAQDGIIIASPAIYGWAIIISCMREIAKRLSELREQRAEPDFSDGDHTSSRRRASRRDSSYDVTPLERQYQLLQDFELDGEAREDPAHFLATAAVDRMAVFSIIAQISGLTSRAFDSGVSFICRSVLFDLVREGMAMVDYGAEPMDAVLGILTPSSDIHERAMELDARIAKRFLADDTLFRPAILDQALARYPFELSSLLRLLAALSAASSQRSAGPTDIVQMLENLPTMTVMVPEHFNGYKLENEDENTNAMALTHTLPLCESKQARSFYGTEYIPRTQLTMGSGEDESRSNVFAIPTGTTGLFVKETRPYCFRLEHPHSGLEYLGLMLSTLLPNSEMLAALPFPHALDRGTAAEIVTLINALMEASMRQHQGAEEARFVPGRLGFALGEETDIIAVVSDIFEMEMLAQLNQAVQDGSLELLITCADFFALLAKVQPERVWAMLARSSLLGLAGGTNGMTAVIGGTEIQSEKDRFLNVCVRLYSHLLDDAVAGLVKRKTKANKRTGRFDSPIGYLDPAATPERTMSAVLAAYTSVMGEAWQSGGMMSESTAVMLSAFERLLKSTYGIAGGSGNGENKNDHSAISSLLLPAARLVVDSFISLAGFGLQTFAAVFTTGLEGLQAKGDIPSTNERRRLIDLVNKASSFLTTLIRTTKMSDRGEDGNGGRVCGVAAQLIKQMPTFASLLALDQGNEIKGELYNLLAEIVRGLNENNANTGSADPLSLLAHLSAEAGKNFLAVISHLDRPLRDLETECAIWDFLAAVMASQQQKWFAIYILTGSLPKDRLKDTYTHRRQSLLAYALDTLSSIQNLPPERAIAMLKFVASAQKAWAWATNSVREHPDFLKNTLDWLNNLHPPSRAAGVAEELLGAGEYHMAAYLCEILAGNIHAGLETGDKSVPKLLMSKLEFLRLHASTVDAYNRSLHRNLHENFARKFDGLGVGGFVRTSANPAPLGREFYYDIELADRMLGHEMAWHGTDLNGRHQHGFKEEFARANVNFSLLEAQKALLRRWMVLATILCECATGQDVLSIELAMTAERCLRANGSVDLDVPGMDEVVRIRAEMAFVILSKLVAVKADFAELTALLPAAWALVRSSPVDFDVATAAEDLRYYRTLLQILYLAIQPHIYSGPTRRTKGPTDETAPNYLDPAIASLLLEIIAKTIAPGFRALCGNLHQNINAATPADFALITAILQATLAVPGIQAVHPQIVEIVAASSLVRGALSLYSWADQLAEVMDQDPVYGEASASFLRTLSTVRPLAEQMALDGVLVQLSSANLSNYFRKPGGKGPFDEPGRMFTIWSESFLPLCLNLLDAVGPPIAAEISAFLNSFPLQLRRAETALENQAPSHRNPHAGDITLGLVSEAHNLCLIGLILESDRARGAASGINAADVPALEFDFRKVKDDAAGLMRQKTSLASRIVPVGQREEGWVDNDVLMGKIVREVSELLQAFGEG